MLYLAIRASGREKQSNANITVNIIEKCFANFISYLNCFIMIMTNVTARSTMNQLVYNLSSVSP